MKKLFILFLVGIGWHSYGQFTQPKNLTAELIDDFNVRLTWTVDFADPNNPWQGHGNASNYKVVYQRSGNSLFDDLNFKEAETTVQANGTDLRYEIVITDNLGAGNWYFRLRYEKKPDDPVTDWSNTAFLVMPVGLGSPVLYFYPDSTQVSTPEVQVRIGGGNADITPQYTLYWDTQYQNIFDNPENYATYSRGNANPNLETIQLAGVFDPDDEIYFIVKSFYNGKEAYSTVYRIIYKPDQKYIQIVTHVANVEDNVETLLYISYEGARTTYTKFHALASSGPFGGSAGLQPVDVEFAPGYKGFVKTTDIFPNLHRKPILVESEYPIDIKVIYRTYYGNSTNIASIDTSPSATRDVVVHGLYEDVFQDSGLAVSNMTSNDGSFAVTIVYVEQFSTSNPYPNLGQLDPKSFLVDAYQTTVIVLRDHFDIPEGVAFTVHINGSVDLTAIGSVNSFHGEFSTIDFLQ